MSAKRCRVTQSSTRAALTTPPRTPGSRRGARSHPTPSDTSLRPLKHQEAAGLNNKKRLARTPAAARPASRLRPAVVEATLRQPRRVVTLRGRGVRAPLSSLPPPDAARRARRPAVSLQAPRQRSALRLTRLVLVAPQRLHFLSMLCQETARCRPRRQSAETARRTATRALQ